MIEEPITVKRKQRRRATLQSPTQHDWIMNISFETLDSALLDSLSRLFPQGYRREPVETSETLGNLFGEQPWGRQSVAYGTIIYEIHKESKAGAHLFDLVARRIADENRAQLRMARINKELRNEAYDVVRSIISEFKDDPAVSGDFWPVIPQRDDYPYQESRRFWADVFAWYYAFGKAAGVDSLVELADAVGLSYSSALDRHSEFRRHIW